MFDIAKAVEKHRALIFEAMDFIWKHPETGYKEVETSKYLEDKYTELGYELIKADQITGFYTCIDTGRPGPEVLILGELDCVICPSHPAANSENGAVHACGHHLQSATLLGIAAALKEQDALDELCGRIRLCAVPAEELLEIEYRMELRRTGKIKYFGGKNEFLYRGYFDGVDLAFMVHAGTSANVVPFWNGCLAKNIIYKGTAAHAGGSPWNGHNALYAANCGMNAINAIRETFKESDYSRVHPIITHGGDVVNTIPENVKLESYVRGKTMEAIIEVNKKVNQALVGAALSVNTNVEIIDMPGYSPLVNDIALMHLAKEAADKVAPELHFTVEDNVTTGSTDMGDLSAVMPVVHPSFAGCSGTLHANNFRVDDPETACITNAKFQLTLLYMLLENGAKRADEIIANFKPRFSSKEEFLAFIEGLNDSGDRITYNENGSAEVRL